MIYKFNGTTICHEDNPKDMSNDNLKSVANLKALETFGENITVENIEVAEDKKSVNVIGKL